ncbi:hypothetical protein HK105_206475 [Polyrhizophydium stewartii]|uniref:Lipase n=1 Tax=Polyrhizophydium stewartii TaxID=2732419 RepID=A0ABR4N3I3_9FUNG
MVALVAAAVAARAWRALAPARRPARRPDRGPEPVADAEASAFELDQPDRRRVVPRSEYYIAFHGYAYEKHCVATPDGFIVELVRIVRKPNTASQAAPANAFSKGPVLLVHGLFQCSGVFVTSGPNSLAFYLAESGFDVWLGNNRCCEKLHLEHSPSSVEHWDWSLEDLARYDFPTLVEFVATQTRCDQITYIGHSQGNAQAFLGLSIAPKIAKRIRCFIALAPAAYIGPLLKQGPMAMLMTCPPRVYSTIFGVKEILPIMNIVQRYFPATVFATLAYAMFNYLFKWADTNWDPKHVRHYFQFTPRPTSTKSIQHWGQISRRGHLGLFDPSHPMTSDAFAVPDILDVSSISCPLVLFYGRRDRIVDGDRLLRECRASKHVNLVLAEQIDHYEHMDVIWARSAPRRVFSKIVATLNKL